MTNCTEIINLRDEKYMKSRESTDQEISLNRFVSGLIVHENGAYSLLKELTI